MITGLNTKWIKKVSQSSLVDIGRAKKIRDDVKDWIILERLMLFS